ncbi:MAG: YdcF family protein [Methylophilaceae bacterium]|nr:YdcF family protein [Methylophilaceae bacterium]
MLLWKGRPALGRGLAALSIALLWIFSLPVTGRALLSVLESGYDGPVDATTSAQAIVVLGGGTRFDAPEFGHDTLEMASLERLRYAALLQRRTGLPILVTGGDPAGRGVAEAVLMQRVLEQEFGVPVRWVEGASNDTIQNAARSRKLLAEAGVETILLVTHAWHMARAKMLFERAGFKVIPAGTGAERLSGSRLTDFLPRASGLQDSQRFFHEVIGLVWARLRSQETSE